MSNWMNDPFCALCATTKTTKRVEAAERCCPDCGYACGYYGHLPSISEILEGPGIPWDDVDLGGVIRFVLYHAGRESNESNDGAQVMRRDMIRLEPGALDDIPVTELAERLAGLDLEIVAKPEGLTIRKARPPVVRDFPGEPVTDGEVA